MGKQLVRVAAAAAGAFMAAFTGASVLSANGDAVQSDLADLSQVSLSEVRTTDNSVLSNSIRRVAAETGVGDGLFSGWNSAAPAALPAP
jgi:FXSXX-COOH protein